MAPRQPLFIPIGNIILPECDPSSFFPNSGRSSWSSLVNKPTSKTYQLCVTNPFDPSKTVRIAACKHRRSNLTRAALVVEAHIPRAWTAAGGDSLVTYPYEADLGYALTARHLEYAPLIADLFARVAAETLGSSRSYYVPLARMLRLVALGEGA